MAAKRATKTDTGDAGAASPSSTSKKAAATKAAPAKKAAKKPAKTSPDTAVDLPPGAEFLRDADWLDQQRQTLLAEREQYTRSAESLAAEAASLMADREPGDVQFDEESGEGDTLAVERDRDLALSAAARQSVELIDQALLRIEDGTYGICLIGGDIIPQERLEAIPEAAVCVTHKVQTFA